MSIVLFLSGILFLTSSKVNITGAVIGISYTTNSIIGIVLILISGILFMAEQDEKSELEKKLSEIENVKIRRELLSDACRAEKFAERGYDVNGLWDPNKTLGENKKHFLEKFYGETSDEIIDGFIKYKKDILKKPFKKEDLKSKEFEDFKEKAVEAIIVFNDNLLTGKFIPLYVGGERPSTGYEGMKQRIVYYGPRELKGKTRSFYNNARKSGEVIVAHEIINPEAIKSPNRLAKAPHIHWELENIMREHYKPLID